MIETNLSPIKNGKKAVVFTLGCKVNSCESASLMTGLKTLGYTVSDELSYADLYIINTCAVTAEAEKKSRQTVARVKKFNPNAQIIVTGCASQKAPQDFLKKQGVTLVTGTNSKDKIIGAINERGNIVWEENEYYEEFMPENPDKTRAYIKVQDGCNNFCSYCIIPYLRGRSRSRNVEKIVEEIERLSPVEAVVTGINLSAYNYQGIGLKGLIDRLSAVNCRIRLGSLEVGVINEEFLTALKNLKDFAPHFHLSLQSGSNAVLKSMNRKYTREEYLEKCLLIKKHFPSAAITTDVIVGYSTESEKDFKDSLDLCKAVGFADVHCFPYSKREGTVGAKLKELPPSVKDERMGEILALKKQLKDSFIQQNLGKEFWVIPEDCQGNFTVGYTENYVKTYLLGKVEDKKVKVVLKEPFEDGAIADIL
ncbi:MAG: tRNA (N(6)-L-threonylcarbamoyladenosine(37)-C(2))-methylthiotransferase MtaB [Clostridia bacterium]|nr:tRNA (N(6)-L-threonylcarbamoyladenosine(37)-C(2))-methylthiotransferase MtaB [Clostridia bacterium]